MLGLRRSPFHYRHLSENADSIMNRHELDYLLSLTFEVVFFPSLTGLNEKYGFLDR